MSELAKVLNRKDGVLRASPLRNFMKVDESFERHGHSAYRTYTVEATFRGAVSWDSEAEFGGGAHKAITAAREHVVEAVFGEFRPVILEARRHLYEGDVRRAIDTLDGLLHQMFDVQPRE